MPVKKIKKSAKKGKVKKKPVARPAAKKNPVKTRKKAVKAVKVKAVKKVLKGTPRNKANVIGKVTHYFPKVRAAVIKLDKPLAAGDTIKIKGHTTDFTQQVNSMQIDRVPVNAAKKGDEIGLLVESRVREHDIVYKP